MTLSSYFYCLVLKCSSGLYLNPAQTNGRREGRRPCLLTSSNIFRKSVSSVLGLFSRPARSVLFLLLLRSPSGQYMSAYLPSSLYVLDSDKREKKDMYNSQRTSLKAHCCLTTLSLTTVDSSTISFPFFPAKSHWTLSLWLWKPTDASRSEIIATASMTDITGSLEQWHSFLKRLEAGGIHAVLFCWWASCL